LLFILAILSVFSALLIVVLLFDPNYKLFACSLSPSACDYSPLCSPSPYLALTYLTRYLRIFNVKGRKQGIPKG
jgi:hypothetical protein